MNASSRELCQMVVHLPTSLIQESIYIQEWPQTSSIRRLLLSNSITLLDGVSEIILSKNQALPSHCHHVIFVVLPSVVVSTWAVAMSLQSPDTYCILDANVTSTESCKGNNTCWEGYDELSIAYILSVPMTIALAVRPMLHHYLEPGKICIIMQVRSQLLNIFPKQCDFLQFRFIVQSKFLKKESI